jgi:N-acetylglucosamine-6-phosphate deacetylase
MKRSRTLQFTHKTTKIVSIGTNRWGMTLPQDILIINADLVTPSHVISKGWLLIREGKIAALGAGEQPSLEGAATLDAGGRTLLPGFIDVHVHGGAGCEAMDAEPDGLRKMAAYYAQHGVTSFLATTWTDSHDRIARALEAIAELIGPQPDGATLLGAHVEGPYLNPDRCGAQSTTHIRRAAPDETLPLLDIGGIRLLALAPEYPENHWLIRECVRRGITVSAAHTAANYEQMQAAVQMGVRQTTHTFNAMTGLHHREPGTVGAALTLPELSCELIADTIHVHPAVMQILYAAKGRDGVILITDAIRGAGMPDGDYPIDDRVVHIMNGTARLSDGTLAGSTLTMDRALYNLMQATSKPLAELWPTSSLNAARAIGVSARKGSLEIGKDADLVLVDDEINIQMTIAEGRVVFQRQAV